jgi:hypothetical protein
LGLSIRAGQAARFAVRRRDGNAVTLASSTPQACVFQDPVPISTLDAVAIASAAEADVRTSVVLQLSLLGTVMPLDVPIIIWGTNAPHAQQDVVRFGGVKAQRELIDHLEANRLHYSTVVYRSLDAAAIAALLGPYTYRGLPLTQVIDQQPIAVSGNYLVFRLNVPNSVAASGDGSPWAAEAQDWQKWLGEHGLIRPVPRTEIIPLPSGGVFAEAVLGRFNSAEKLDMTRFWNWQDSPIPLAAPDIAPLQAGSRAQSEDLQPGQLSPSVLSIQAPTALPDATGVAAMLGAIQNGNMFRDMSGMAQTAALAQAALQASAQGATAAGSQAAQNLATTMQNHTERMRIAAQVAMAMMGLPSTGGGGSAGGARPAQNVTEEGARLNQARDLDARSSNGMGGANGVAGAEGGGGAGGVTDAASPVFAGDESGSTAPAETYEGELFRRQTGATGADIAQDIIDASAGGGDLTESDGGEVVEARTGPRTRRRSRSPAKRAKPKQVRVDIQLFLVFPEFDKFGFWKVGMIDQTGKSLVDISEPWKPATTSAVWSVLTTAPEIWATLFWYPGLDGSQPPADINGPGVWVEPADISDIANAKYGFDLFGIIDSVPATLTTDQPGDAPFQARFTELFAPNYRLSDLKEKSVTTRQGPNGTLYDWKMTLVKLSSAGAIKRKP